MSGSGDAHLPLDVGVKDGRVVNELRRSDRGAFDFHIFLRGVLGYRWVEVARLSRGPGGKGERRSGTSMTIDSLSRQILTSSPVLTHL